MSSVVPNHQAGSLRSTLGVARALRSAKGSFSSSSSSSDASAYSAGGRPGTDGWAEGFDTADGLGGAAGRAGCAGGESMWRLAMAEVGLPGEVGDLPFSVIMRYI